MINQCDWNWCGHMALSSVSVYLVLKIQLIGIFAPYVSILSGEKKLNNVEMCKVNFYFLSYIHGLQQTLHLSNVASMLVWCLYCIGPIRGLNIASMT